MLNKKVIGCQIPFGSTSFEIKLTNSNWQILHGFSPFNNDLPIKDDEYLFPKE